MSVYPLQEGHIHLHKFIRGLFCGALKTSFTTLSMSLLFTFYWDMPILIIFLLKFYNGSFLIIYSVVTFLSCDKQLIGMTVLVSPSASDIWYLTLTVSWKKRLYSACHCKTLKIIYGSLTFSCDLKALCCQT